MGLADIESHSGLPPAAVPVSGTARQPTGYLSPPVPSRRIDPCKMSPEDLGDRSRWPLGSDCRNWSTWRKLGYEYEVPFAHLYEITVGMAPVRVEVLGLGWEATL